MLLVEIRASVNNDLRALVGVPKLPETSGVKFSGESTPLPLAAASIRLRGKPGRPRKGRPDSESCVPGSDPPFTRASEDGCAQPVPRLDERRLLDVGHAAAYLDMAEDTVRELDASGVLTPARVKIPGHGGQPIRKVLFDRLKLDRLVVGWRTPA